MNNKRIKSTKSTQKPKKHKPDPFFSGDKPRRKQKHASDDDSIKSSDSEDEEYGEKALADVADVDGGGDVDVEETAGEKRKRMAEAYLEKMREMARREIEEGDDDDDVAGGGDVEERVGRMLHKQQMEDSGRARRLIAKSVQKPKTTDEFRFLVKHRQSVTAVVLSEDDSTGFSASKDGYIIQWDVETGKTQPYVWPSEEVLRSHGANELQGKAKKRSKHVLALAVSSDGRYLASGGFDRHIHLWDTRTREHIQAFKGHKGPVSCLTFRQGTSELFSGSYDRTIKLWNAEDRAFVHTLFGHQSDVLTIDCLRKERLLTVGRDRTMHLWKVPEESQLVFRAPASSLECCCFISDDEFLSGSDDGSVEHWSVMRKKPLHIIKNAHPLLTPNNLENNGQNDDLPNGDLNHAPESVCSSAHSWVGSVAVCRGTDLAASGAGNGMVRLWEIENDTKGVKPLFELPLVSPRVICLGQTWL
ncbi:transducin/WD40 repeat-like superfamily protein [Artemisia annua]|uniref:Transducin/WD40 repeat-like superfamily protein n=1 Tax=Artemisia annua TaxID=35608 RepID=A0A2U1MQ71_ARTAN|nr:transducin/WD40 repeat-like superfamily protein [Artemisia annua]